jgi:regulator of sigma E protease
LDSESNRNDQTVNESEDQGQASSSTGRLFYLFLLGGLAAYLLYAFDVDGLIAIAKIAVGLTLVVFVHELGHFAVAKSCDVHVEAFSIGFGPAIPGCSFRYGETTYMIGVLPLGGYVKMVGEGPDAEDGEDDPRSFKNKSVWQRMAIISAGVTMNLILALVCFVFVYRAHGAERSPGVVEGVDPGSPAWKLGVKSGDVIQWIGKRGPYPYFDELRPVVMNSRESEKLKFVWGPPKAPEAQMHHADIEPKKTAEDSRPIIGIAQTRELRLVSAEVKKEHELPVSYESSAARAEPPFRFDDEIVGTTDPRDPKRVTDLPPDPRHPGYPDFFEFLKRMEELAGQPVVVRVVRESGGRKETVDIHVPRANHWVLGMRMRMGAIAAVRDGSPAAKAGLLPDDIIDSVEVKDRNGQTIRFLSSGPGKIKKPAVIEKELDPVRLPWQLSQWFEKAGSPTVHLTVVRSNPSNGESHTAQQKITLPAQWDPSWRFTQEVPVAPSSPMSIPELGLAYRVETRIEDVAAGSAASHATLLAPATIKFQKGDVITQGGKPLEASEGDSISLQAGDQISLRRDNIVKAIRFTAPRPHPKDKLVPEQNWRTINSNQWAHFFYLLQADIDSKEIDLQVDRDGQILNLHLIAQEDKDWPLADRGILLILDTRLQKAQTLGQAIGMGMNETWDFITQIYQNLEGLMTGRVSPNNFGGPFRIAYIGYKLAGQNYYRLITFLGIISVNLAVINFLPIPVLDGGHMVFLLYEKLRGRPAPRRIQEAATYIGLALILCLFVAVLFLDYFNFRRM